jgi:hypothetical protein
VDGRHRAEHLHRRQRHQQEALPGTDRQRRGRRQDALDGRADQGAGPPARHDRHGRRGDVKFTLRVPTQIGTGTITKVSFVAKDALAASDTNYVKWKVVNKGAAGAGTQVLVDDTAASNTTKVTGGTALAAYTPRDLTLATLTIGTERDVTGGDVLEITLTVTGTLANALTESSLLVELTFAN